MNRCFRLAVLILIGAEEIAPVTGIASTMDTTMSTETDTLDPVRALARLIVGPRLPVSAGSRFSLDELRDVRWTSHATSQEKREALSLARAILAAGYRPPSSQPAGSEAIKVLRRVEWCGPRHPERFEQCCPSCFNLQSAGHMNTCALARELRLAAALSATAPADGGEVKSSLLAGEAGPGGGVAALSIPGPAACDPADVRPGVLAAAIEIIERQAADTAVQNDRRRGEPPTSEGRIYWQGVKDCETWLLRKLGEGLARTVEGRHTDQHGSEG